MAVNITALKQIEIELRIAKEQAENVINSSIDMIVAVDDHRRIIDFNPAAEKAFGYSKEEVLGRSIDILYASPNSEGLEVYEERAREGTASPAASPTRDETARSSTATSRRPPSATRMAAAVGAMGISHDITEQASGGEANCAISIDDWQRSTRSRIASPLILDADQLLTEVVRLIATKFGCYASYVVLQEGDSLAFRAIARNNGVVVEGGRVNLSERSIPGWVVAHAQVLNVPNVMQNAGYYRPLELPGARAELVAPMVVGGRILGALAIVSDEAGAFGASEQEILQPIADQLSLALENARSFEEAKSQRDEATAISAMLSRQTDWIAAMSRVTGALLEATDMDSAARIIIDGVA